MAEREGYRGVRELRAYPLQDDDTLGVYAVLHTFGQDTRVHRGIDGMCLDTDGNIIATAGWRAAGPGPMIYVFAPSGRVLETHPVPVDMPSNCTFGDADLSTLYVTTSGGHLFGCAIPAIAVGCCIRCKWDGSAAAGLSLRLWRGSCSWRFGSSWRPGSYPRVQGSERRKRS